MLKIILGAAFLYVPLRMIYKGSRRSVEAKTGNIVPGGALAKSSIGFVIGVLTGIISLGGGYALVLSMICLLGAPVKITIGTSLASFISMTLISGAFKIYQGLVDVIVALSLGAGMAIGAQIGSRLVPRVPASYIRLSSYTFL